MRITLTAITCTLCTIYSFGQGTPEFLEIASGFTEPVAICNAGDGSNHLYVVEQSGYIEVITDIASGQVQTVPFLDIDARVESGDDEEGLLGLAFDPDFVSNGYLYVYYTFPEEEANNVDKDSSRISRFQLLPGDSVVNPQSEYVLLEFEQPYGNHNAGDLHFGVNDDYLYISVGDGGSGGDPQNHSQSPTDILGNILRIDVSADQFPGDPDRNYTIPPSNPYIGNSSALDEVYAFGLRNPWRFCFDRANGDMYIGDVGQIMQEEVSYLPADTSGLNFGWKCDEGTHHYSNSTPCQDSRNAGEFTDPIFTYPRSDGRSITGGCVYRGSIFENFKGYYFFADYVNNNMWRLKKDGNSWTVVPKFNMPIANVSAFGESESGEIYVAARGAGRVYRIIDRSVCPMAATVSTISGDSTYVAENTITSDATLPNSSMVNFYAGQSISLTDGFTVPGGAIFQAIAAVCGLP